MRPENTNPPQNVNPQRPQRVWSDVARPARPVQGYAARPMQEPLRPAAQPQVQPQPQLQPPPQPAPRTFNPVQAPASAPQPRPVPVQPRPQQVVNQAPQPVPLQPRPGPPINQIYPSAAPTVAAPQPRPAFAQPQTRGQSEPDVVLDEISRNNSLELDAQQRAGRPSLPKGVFAVIAVSLLGVAAGVLDKTQNNSIYTAILALDALLAVGLLFLRQEVVRKTALGLAVVTATASAALVFSYRGLAASTVSAESAFVAEAKKLQDQSPTKQLTDEQQQHLDAMQLQLEAQQRGVGKNSLYVYGKYGATVLAFAGVAFYLTRSRLKEAFSPTD